MKTTLFAPGEFTTHEAQAIKAAADQMPASPARSVLEEIASVLARGHGATLITQDQVLTPNEAAELIGISRPHLLKFMDLGMLDFEYVGTHRRIKLDDLRDFDERRQAASKLAAEAASSMSTSLDRHLDDVAPLTADALADLDDL